MKINLTAIFKKLISLLLVFCTIATLLWLTVLSVFSYNKNALIEKVNNLSPWKDEYRIEIPNLNTSFFGQITANELRLVPRGDRTHQLLPLIFHNVQLHVTKLTNLLALRIPDLSLEIQQIALTSAQVQQLSSPRQTIEDSHYEQQEVATSNVKSLSSSKDFFIKRFFSRGHVHITLGALKFTAITEKADHIIETQFPLVASFKWKYSPLSTRSYVGLISSSEFHLHLARKMYEGNETLAFIHVLQKISQRDFEKRQQAPLTFSTQLQLANIAKAFEMQLPALESLCVNGSTTLADLMLWIRAKPQAPTATPLKIAFSTKMTLRNIKNQLSSTLIQSLVKDVNLPMKADTILPLIELSGNIHSNSPFSYEAQDAKIQGTLTGGEKKKLFPLATCAFALHYPDEQTTTPSPALNSPGGNEDPPPLFTYKIHSTLKQLPYQNQISKILAKLLGESSTLGQHYKEFLRTVFNSHPTAASSSPPDANEDTSIKNKQSLSFFDSDTLTIQGELNSTRFESIVTLEGTNIDLGSKQCALSSALTLTVPLNPISTSQLAESPSFSQASLHAHHLCSAAPAANRAQQERSPHISAQALLELDLNTQKCSLTSSSVKILHSADHPPSELTLSRATISSQIAEDATNRSSTTASTSTTFSPFSKSPSIMDESSPHLTLSLSVDPLLFDRIWHYGSASKVLMRQQLRKRQAASPGFETFQMHASLPNYYFSLKDLTLEIAQPVSAENTYSQDSVLDPTSACIHLHATKLSSPDIFLGTLDMELGVRSFSELARQLYDSPLEIHSLKELLLYNRDTATAGSIQATAVHTEAMHLDTISVSMEPLHTTVQEIQNTSSPTADMRTLRCHLVDKKTALDLFFALRLKEHIASTETALTLKEITLDDLSGIWRDKKASLSEPIRLKVSPEGIFFSLKELILDEGQISAQCSLPFPALEQFDPTLASSLSGSSDQDHAGQRLMTTGIALTAQNFPLDLLTPFLPYGVQGRLDSEVKLSIPYIKTDKEALKGSCKATLHDLSMESDKKHSFFKEIVLNGKVDHKSGHLSILRDNKELLSCTSHSPFLLTENSAGEGLRVQYNAEAPVHCAFDLHLSNFVRFFISKDFVLEGRAHGTLQFPLASPLSAKGTALLENVSFRYKPLKIQLFQNSTDKAHVEIASKVIRVDQLKGTDRLEGFFDLATTLDLQDGFSYAFKARTNNLKLFESVHFKTQTTGDLAFTGASREALLSGKLSLPNARAYIPAALPSSLPELGDFEIKRLLPSLERIPPSPMLVAQAAQPDIVLSHQIDPENETDFSLLLDLNLNLPAGSRLSGRGLDSSWQGDLALGGSLHQPQLHGGLNLTDGNLTLGGKRFTVQEGKLHFHGDPKKETRIHIVSEFPLQTVTIRAILQGPLSAPKLDFQSTPFMSLPDIFSQLLFRKSKEALTSLQALQVAQLVLETRGESPDLDLISKLRQTSGIDVINVGSSKLSNRSKNTLTRDESGAENSGSPSQDPSLTSYTIKVGKYITPNLLLALTRDVSTQQTTLDMEIDLTRHLSLIAEYDTVYRDGHLNLMWTKDY